MRVAIVHDYLTQFGGAERVLLALMEIFPNAPVFTLLYDRDTLGVPIDESRVHTSFLQRLPWARTHHRYFPLLMPLASEKWNFDEYDVVVSATHSFSKGVITASHTLHLSYCFTPTRYVWDDCHRYVREFSRSRFFQKVAPLGLSYIRLWDYYASQRVDKYLTISNYVAKRIKKYYQNDAIVIPPPVNVDAFTVTTHNKGYYLVVSRLVPYKRIDIAIEACEKLQRPLKIVGSGPEEPILRAKAGKYTEFVGFVEEAGLSEMYAGARALLFPQEEDFGITPLEAAASGKPTIAYQAGGALETILENKTGLFFEKQNADSLGGAILESEQMIWDPHVIRQHSEKYRRQAFLQALRETVHTQWMAHVTRYTTRL